MWNIGAGAAIAGVSAAYYALIRKNVELENRAMDVVAGEMFSKDRIKEASGDVNGKDPNMKYNYVPSTASQNLMRKNFQLLSKQSGNIFGINVANTNKNTLAERNNSDPELDRIVRRTECSSSYPRSRSAAAFVGAQRSKSDFGVGGKFRHNMLANRSLFDVDTSSSMEIPKDMENDDDSGTKICHCKYSASSEDIPLREITEEQIETESCFNVSKTETVKEKSSEALPNQAQKPLHCSFLSEEYVPRLENRDSSASKHLPTKLKSSYCVIFPTKTDENITQVIFPRKESQFTKVYDDFEFGAEDVSNSSIDKYIEQEVYSDDYDEDFNTECIHCEECSENGCYTGASSEKSSEYCDVATMSAFGSRNIKMTDIYPEESDIPVDPTKKKLCDSDYSRFTNKVVVEQEARLLLNVGGSTFGLVDSSFSAIQSQFQDCATFCIETCIRMSRNPVCVITAVILTIAVLLYSFLFSMLSTEEENENPADSVIVESMSYENN